MVVTFFNDSDVTCIFYISIFVYLQTREIQYKVARAINCNLLDHKSVGEKQPAVMNMTLHLS